MVDQLADVLMFFDTSLLVVAEQVIKEPKISLQGAIPQRSVLRWPQLAEQLVEVPTVFFFVEQTVDIPVHEGVKRARGDLHGHLPRQCETASSRGAPQVVCPRTDFNSGFSRRSSRFCLRTEFHGVSWS